MKSQLHFDSVPFRQRFLTIAASGAAALLLVERAAFAEATPAPLASAPSHRYSFNEPATNNATGLTFLDSIGTAHGVVRGAGATFTGSRFTLAGGASTTQAYGDLPNGLLSANSADNGGSGEVTIEGWVKVTGVRSSQRVFDFGSTLGGELSGPGGGGAAIDSFSLHGQLGASISSRRVEVRNSDSAPLVTNTADFATTTFNTDTHFAVTWQETTGEVIVYENGLPVTAMTTRARLSAVNDINNWLGRANNTADQNAQIEYLELRLHHRALSPGEVRGSFQFGPDLLNVAGPVGIYAQPQAQSVVEGTTATFSVGASGTPPFYYQWFRGSAPVAGANGATFSFVTSPADNAAVFHCVASNFVNGTGYLATSSNALLTILADTNSPVLLRASALESNLVRAVFNEPVRADSVGNLANYSLTGPGGNVSLLGASLDGTATNLLLTTGRLFNGSNYTLTVSGVRDTSSNSNLIAPGSAVTFRADLRLHLGNAALLHRYSFNEPATNNATGRAFLDAIGAAHGVVRGSGAGFTGTRLLLDGGPSTTSAYGDLPNGLLSSNSVDRGGAGGVSFEAWVKITGGRTASRLFDFGSTTGGEVTAPGGGGNGLDYLTVLAQVATDVNSRRVEVRNDDGAAGGANTLDYPTATFNTDFHLVVTWDEASGEILIYENGQPIGRLITDERISAINDVNNWLGRSNFAVDQNMQGEFDEFRIYEGVLASNAVAASFTYGPDRVAVLGPVLLLTQPTSVTVTELRPATFTVDVGGFPLPQFQWLKNGAPIPGATNSSYTLAEPALSDNGAQFSVIASNVVSNTLYSATSSSALLGVVGDTSAPVLVSAGGLTRQSLTIVDGVRVEFDEGVLPATATNLANYTLTGPGGSVSLIGASQDESFRIVSLAASTPLLEGATYTLRVNNVRDRSTAANVIAPNSQTNFVAAAFTLRTVGSVTASNLATSVPGGYELSAAGRDVGGSGDDFSFQSQLRLGDFDVQVRVDSLGLSDGYSAAGLMARDGLATNAAFAAVLASSGLGGVKFQSRANARVNAVSGGSMPVNYPDTWLRLRRSGDEFTGFGSFDGQTWLRLGSATVTMPAQVYVGFAVSSHDAANAVVARFRDAAYASGGRFVNRLALPFEPLGPCSRRTGLVISELMYHPLNLPGGTNSLEFIEIFNGQDYFEDLSGFRIEGDVHYDFPPGTTLQSGGFLVVARDPVAVQSAYGIRGVLGPWRMQTNVVETTTNVTPENLPNSRGTVRLENELGAHLLEVNYDSEGEWPAAADGAGHSLVLARPSYGERSAKAWAASEFIGGSPGRGESYALEPQRAVVINEFLAHTDDPLLDFVELFNTSTQPVEVSGCWLSDDFGTNKFRVPDGTVLPGRGFLAWDETQLGFSLSSDGEEIFLVNSNRTRVLDALRFGGQAKGVSRGRSPDGAPGFVELNRPTFGTNNAPPLRRDVVINEIMYHPISGNDDDEFVELYNRGADPVKVGNWRFVDGINFTIPGDTTLNAGSYLVVAKNRTNLLARYPELNPGAVVGDYGGVLANGGERVALAMPDYSLRTNGAVITTNIFYIVVNEVTYGDGGRWGQWSDGGGSSLELIDPRADNRLAANWADSDETAKAPWTLIERTALIDLGMTSGNGTPNRCELFIEGPGECLVDDVEVRNNGDTNRVLNAGFESGGAGWAFQGTHVGTFVQTGGAFSGRQCLHLRAIDRGDAGPNRVRTGIAPMTTGGTNQATLRAHVRWLRGNPNFLMRLRGQWLECAGRMTLPTNLGTPGAANSRRVPNTGPAIADVTHHPSLPAASEPVVVTARVNDPDGLSSLLLRQRLDPNRSLLDTPMRDDGTGGDAVAGDGIYSATIPGYPAGTLVAFHLRATDANVSAATTTFPGDAPLRECLVRFGETNRPGSIATYRLWLTQSNLTYWATRERNSNEGLDATFVYGDGRRVIYNAQTLYSGSPWHTANGPYNGPLGNTCDYEVNFPKDDVFLGTTDFVLNGQNPVYSVTFNQDVSAQAETTAYWFGRKLGLGFNHKRHIFVVVNGLTRGMLYFDHQQPNSEIIDEYFPNDANGHLHKIEDWFEFDDAGNGFDIITCTMQNFVVGRQKRTERYRFTWRPRAGTPPNDFSDLFALVDAANSTSPEPYTSASLGLLEMRRAMRVWALEHMVGNWDSYGYERGKNMYAYKPKQGPWQLLLWDVELVLGKDSRGTSDPLFSTAGSEPVVSLMYAHPPFVREYWCAMSELVNSWMLPEVYGPLVDARFSALRANEVPVDTPTAMKNWIAARRAYILTQIPVANFSVGGTNFIQTTNNYITLSGTAPVTAKDILVNGREYPITWTSVTAWSLRVAVGPGTKDLVVSAVDGAGHTLSNRTVTVNYTGPAPDPAGSVVISEIMFNPPADSASFIELFNTQAAFAFDLSGWRVNGLSYTFPAGAVLPPRSFMVLAKNRGEFAKLYGGTKVAFDEFNGGLDNDGETLTLLRPGAQIDEEVVVDKVKYEARAPWPAAAGGRGGSLQIVDPTQDNARVSNWSDGTGWRFFSLTGIPAGTRLLLYLDTAANVYLDEIALVAGPVPAVGANLIINGDFESPLMPAWKLLGTNGTNTATTSAARLNGSFGLDLRFNPAGNAGQYLYQDLATFASNATHTLSFWYLPSTNASSLIVRMSAGFRATLDVRAPSGAQAVFATPGTNSALALALPPYPLVWLNEVLPVNTNTNGLTDGQGEREPWIELYNSSPAPIALDGLYLTDDYLNLTKWPFPAGAVLNANEFKILFADGETNESTGTEWHANFRLNSGTGAVALSRLANGAPQIVDYLNFDNLAADRSYGSFPEGQLFNRQEFFHLTPGGTNNGTAAPLVVYINEWMAANSGFLRDPADNHADDWFELYNPNTFTVDLGGYFLTDNLTNHFQYQIPNNGHYTIAPLDYLLVWADGEPGQNSTNRADLHVSFQLRQLGEAIGLFAADGRLIDAVTFGEQTNNLSQGRYPEGTGPIYFMTTPSPRAANVNPNPSPPPQITDITVAGAQVSLTVSTIPGRTYRIESKDDLGQLSWTPLGGNAVASGSSLTIQDGLGASSQRFYRAVLLP